VNAPSFLLCASVDAIALAIAYAVGRHRRRSHWPCVVLAQRTGDRAERVHVFETVAPRKAYERTVCGLPQGSGGTWACWWAELPLDARMRSEMCEVCGRALLQIGRHP
jgi:hypothetical protein